MVDVLRVLEGDHSVAGTQQIRERVCPSDVVRVVGMVFLTTLKLESTIQHARPRRRWIWTHDVVPSGALWRALGFDAVFVALNVVVGGVAARDDAALVRALWGDALAALKIGHEQLRPSRRLGRSSRWSA